MDTPVLILIFNRPNKVRILIDSLSAIKPTRLYIAADGPRTDVPSDMEKCREAREIAQKVSWPCEVTTNFSDANLGVDPAVERGINWFFQHETEGLIFEDDCIPNSEFARFAASMLEQYRDTTEVMMVSGNNFQDDIRRGDGSYYASRYANIWGWATWKRAWNHYDTTLGALPEFAESHAIEMIRPQADEQRHWLRYFKKLQKGIYSAWDAKWIFTIWHANGVCITPNVNLVRNIGFDAEGTHTTATSTNGTEEIGILENPIAHPSSLEPDDAADRYIFNRNYRATFFGKVRHRLISLFS